MSHDDELGQEFRAAGDALLDDAGLHPDFEDVLGRVEHRRGRGGEGLDELLPSAPEITDELPSSAEDRHWLRPYVEAYRDLVDASLEEHDVQPGGWSPEVRRRGWTVAIALLAAMLLGFVGLSLVSGSSTGRYAPGDVVRDVGVYLFSARPNAPVEETTEPKPAAPPKAKPQS